MHLIGLYNYNDAVVSLTIYIYIYNKLEPVFAFLVNRHILAGFLRRIGDYPGQNTGVCVWIYGDDG